MADCKSEMEGYYSAAQVLKMLGHPLRLKIVAGLYKQPTCVRDIWTCLDLPQAAVSQQLAFLKKCGIIEGRRIGVEMHYTVINPLAKAVVDSLGCKQAAP